MVNRLVVFDLDGTLIDSREDLAASVNLTRGEFGLPPLSTEKVTSYVGDGVRKLITRVFAGYEGKFNLDEALVHMRRHYEANLVARTTLYPGVAEGLMSLRGKGVKLAIVSNKPTEFCGRIMDHFGLGALFDFVIGGDSGMPLKPDPASILHCLDGVGAAKSNAWIVGDNHTDLAAGRNAGIKRCFAAYGFGELAGETYDLRIDAFLQFVEYALSGK